MIERTLKITSVASDLNILCKICGSIIPRTGYTHAKNARGTLIIVSKMTFFTSESFIDIKYKIKTDVIINGKPESFEIDFWDKRSYDRLESQFQHGESYAEGIESVLSLFNLTRI